MGEELSMARSEDRKQQSIPSMLLAESGTGLPSHAPSGRDKGKKTAAAKSRGKNRSTQNPSTKGKTSTKAKDSDGGTSKQQRPRPNDKDRQSDRGVKGGNHSHWRSATELGIEWVGSYCPNGSPHYFVAAYYIDTGTLFKCHNCYKHKWLPIDFKDATILGQTLERQNKTTAYCKFLDQFRQAKIMIAKLQYLWYAKQQITDSRELINLSVAIMEDKEYDRKEAYGEGNSNRLGRS